MSIFKDFPKRIDFIDVARGLFIFWMISGHSLILSHVPIDSYLQHIRPSGWATISFIMLSGMSVAMVFSDKNRSFDKSRKRLKGRAIEIGSIAYISNALFQSVQVYLDGYLTPDIFIRILTFRFPWTISSILIPVFFLLLLAPFLIRLSFRLSHWSLLIIFTLANLAVPGIRQLMPGIFNHIIIYQLITLVLLAIWSFGLGVFFKKQVLQVSSWRVIMPISFCFLVAINLFPNIRTFIPNFFININEFVFGLGIAFIFASLKILVPFKYVLSVLGRSSLLVFIIHRPMIHALIILGSDKAGTAEFGAFIMTIVFIACVVMCLIKENNPKISKGLKRIGF
jgi:hypothetical protein